MFDDTVLEMGVVASMLAAARPYRLETEVVCEAMLVIQDDGCTIAEACARALVEWDL